MKEETNKQTAYNFFERALNLASIVYYHAWELPNEVLSRSANFFMIFVVAYHDFEHFGIGSTEAHEFSYEYNSWNGRQYI